jgi:enoyl-CoA hydratase
MEQQTQASQEPSQDILYELRDGIGRVTFNRPQARNAFTFAMYERLAEICGEANRDRSIKVLVLQGAGDKAFASGTDINQFRAFTTPQHALEYESRIDRVLTQIEQCRVPTIAAITGACTGGGAGIAACCDLRIGTKTTRIGFPIARTLGNCLSMSSISRLTALVGPARVKDLTLTLNATKQALVRLQRRLSREEGEDLILMCYMSRDFREGLDAFLNKRPPQWVGE